MSTTPRPSDQQVVDAFDAFIQERAAAGVLYARAVMSITFNGETVLVTFAPATAGATDEAFLSSSPFDSLAEFAGAPIAFKADEGRALRTRVSRVAAAMADGRDLGALTAADIYHKGTGAAWRPGL